MACDTSFELSAVPAVELARFLHGHDALFCCAGVVTEADGFVALVDKPPPLVPTTPGCVFQVNAEGRRRIAVNLRLSEPEPIAHLPIEHFDGLAKWEELSRDGRCVRDLWF